MSCVCFFFSSRRRHTRFDCDWSSDVCSSDLDSAPADVPSAAPAVDRAVPQLPAPIWAPAIVYGIFFGGIGAAFPYLPVYYRSIGISVEGVGFLSALAALVGLIAAPVCGSVAD